MIRKLFIVARGNTALYESLQSTLGPEGDVAIIYDRRCARTSASSEPERRHHRKIDEEIVARGWAVIRTEHSEPVQHDLQLATTRYNKLREIWRMPEKTY